MIIRHFLSWVRTAPASERAEATRALARAFLISDLTPEDRQAAEGALLTLLDDPSPLVRQAMSDVFADRADAPAEIVRVLTSDQFAVAAPLLEHSPLLIDADLVDIVATGDEAVQCAVARRIELPTTVAAAIAEVGCAQACLDLIENPDAEIAPLSLDRIVERFGHVATLREAMLQRNGLPAATRLALAGKLSSALVQFVTSRDWLSAERADRMAEEARERAAVDVAVCADGRDITALVRHLRASKQLTPGLLLRSLLSGHVELLHEALVQLTDMPSQRVAGLLHERGGASLNALLTRAGFPPSMLTAFRSAIEAGQEVGFVDTAEAAIRLRRRMVERVLTACEHDQGASEALLTLLRRYATESAREEARLYCDELVAEDAVLAFDRPLAA